MTPFETQTQREKNAKVQLAHARMLERLAGKPASEHWRQRADPRAIAESDTAYALLSEAAGLAHETARRLALRVGRG